MLKETYADQFTPRSRPNLHCSQTVRRPPLSILLTQLTPPLICSGVVGLTRSYGAYLPTESITLNAVCPNVVRTHISTDVFYDMVEPMGLLVPLKNVVDAFESFLDSDVSGQCLEVGPKGTVPREAAEYLDEESRKTMELVHERSKPLQAPETKVG